MNKIKIYYILLSIIAILLSGCKSSTEDLIGDEFRKYVRENFDDPKSFKEIVSTEPSDTINNEKYIKFLIGSLDAAKSSELIMDSLMIKNLKDGIFFAKVRAAKMRGEYASFTDLFDKGIEAMLYYLNNYQMVQFSYENNIRSFLADTATLVKTDMIVYKIKYRSKSGDTLVLNEAYAVIDNTKERNNITIRLNPMMKNELPKPILDILEVMEIYLGLVQAKQKAFGDIMDGYNKLKVVL